MRLGLLQEEYKKLEKTLKKDTPVLGYRYWSVSKAGRLMAPIASTAAFGGGQAPKNANPNGNVWSPGINKSMNNHLLYSFPHLDNGQICIKSYFDIHTGKVTAGTGRHTCVIGAIWMHNVASKVNMLTGKHSAVAALLLPDNLSLESQKRIYNASQFYNVPLVSQAKELKDAAIEWRKNVFPELFEAPYGIHNTTKMFVIPENGFEEKYQEYMENKAAKFKAKKEKEAKIKAEKEAKAKERALKQYREIKAINDELTFEDYQAAIKVVRKQTHKDKYAIENIAKVAVKIKAKNAKLKEMQENQHNEVKAVDSSISFEEYLEAIKLLKLDKTKGSSKYKAENITKIVLSQRAKAPKKVENAKQEIPELIEKEFVEEFSNQLLALAINKTQ